MRSKEKLIQLINMANNNLKNNTKNLGALVFHLNLWQDDVKWINPVKYEVAITYVG